jgi:DNA repair protein RecO (recombination protein O)
MLHKTRGIVLRVSDYSESSVVAKIFTEKFGLQSYIINGVKKPRSRVKMNMLQPLHLLDMVVYHNPNGGIQKVSDIRNLPVLTTIPYDIIKSSIAIFLNEILYKSLKEQSEDVFLFEYVYKAVELLDESRASTANFHLIFLTKLTKFLGFYPDMSFADSSAYFDLKNGVFTNVHPSHSFLITDENLIYFIKIMRSSLNNIEALKIGAESRKYLLDKVIDYFSLHIDNFGIVKSKEILEEILG